MNPSVIVCPVDFSASGEAALRRALTLAEWHDAELHVLSVRPGRTRRTAGSGMTTGDRFLERLTELIAAVDPGEIPVTPVVLAGDPAGAVAEYARAKGAELVVVGQGGRRGGRFWPSGVLATDVARAVSSPTLIVPNEAVPGPDGSTSFSNILCAIDFSETSLLALHQALALAQRSGGRITLLHVLEGFPHEPVYSAAAAFRTIDEYRTRVETVKSELRALVPAEALNWCEIETEVVSGIPHNAIVGTARARQADLVVIGRPRRTRFDRIVMASTVSGVLRRARCPVLAVPEPSSVIETARNAADAVRHDRDAGSLLTFGATPGVASSDSPRQVEVVS